MVNKLESSVCHKCNEPQHSSAAAGINVQKVYFRKLREQIAVKSTQSEVNHAFLRAVACTLCQTMTARYVMTTRLLPTQRRNMSPSHSYGEVRQKSTLSDDGCAADVWQGISLHGYIMFSLLCDCELSSSLAPEWQIRPIQWFAC